MPTLTIDLEADTYKDTPERETDQRGDKIDHEKGCQHIAYIQKDHAGGKERKQDGHQQHRTLDNFIDEDHRRMELHRHKIEREEIAEVRQQQNLPQVLCNGCRIKTTQLIIYDKKKQIQQHQISHTD